jgi:hypothetical protein
MGSCVIFCFHNFAVSMSLETKMLHQLCGDLCSLDFYASGLEMCGVPKYFLKLP